MAQLIEFCLRHPYLIGITLTAVVALIVNELRLQGQAGVSMPAQQAVRLINQGATVVDVRDAEKFARSHIVDAIHLPAAQVAASAATKLKKKRPVLLVCDSGAQSARLVAPLRKAGFDNAWALGGGLAAWERDNLPVVASKASG